MKKFADEAGKRFRFTGDPWILFAKPDGAEHGRVGDIPGGSAVYLKKFDTWRGIAEKSKERRSVP